jgi:hypothetical protein
MSDPELSSWVEHYTRFRGRGRPDAVVRRFGRLLAQAFELRAQALRRAGPPRLAPREALAASILRAQARRAQTLAAAVQALTDDRSTARIAMTAFANVLVDSGFCETLEAAVRDRARAAPRPTKRRRRRGN